MGYLSQVVDIADLGQHKFVTIYGKSGSGKNKVQLDHDLQVCTDGIHVLCGLLT